MKNFTSIAATVLLFVFLLLSVGLNVKQFFKYEKKAAEIESLIQKGAENVPVSSYTKDSITHTVYNETIIRDGEAEKRAAIGKTYADSLQKALNLSINKIDQVTKYAAFLETKIALKEGENKLGKRVLSHKDKSLSLDYYPDTDSVDLAVNVGLNDVRYWKRKWILGNKQHYIDLYPDDKRVTISGLKSYTLKEKPQKRLGVGLSAGYGVTAQDNTLKTAPYVGVGINYNLFEF